MKIAFLNDGIYSYALGVPSGVGGAERQQWLLACALVAHGWTVSVGIRSLLADGERRTINGVNFVGIGKGQFFLAWYRFLAVERPQWVYWRGADHLLGPTTAISKYLGVRTIFSTAFDSDVQPRRALFRRRRWWPLYAWGLSWSNIIFVQHGGQLASLAPHWRAKAVILRSMVHQLANPKPHSERAPYVVWAAILRQPKRPDVLMQIARETPTTRFIVCGGTTTHRCPPGYSERIVTELQAVPNIDYLGQVAPDQALQIIANASLLLSTSDEEGFPNTFLEAWSSGTPVVSLKIDPDSIISQTKLGAVSLSVERVIIDIRYLLDSPQQRDEIAVRARRYVSEHHSEAAIVKAFQQRLAACAERGYGFRTHSLHNT